MDKKACRPNARLAGGIVTVLFLSAAVWLLGRLVTPKYASGVLEGALIGGYYGQTDIPHEVLFVGDCEAYEAFSPPVLWERAGVSSYVRGTAQQLMWQSRDILLETLTYETPKAVVVTVCPLRYGEGQKEAYNRMTLDGMRLSRHKLRSVKESLTEGESVLSYLVPLLRYHERITALTAEDTEYLFIRPDVGFNGFLVHTQTEPYEWLPTSVPPKDLSFPRKALEALEEICRVCAEKGTAVFLVKSPCLFPEWYPEWDEALESFAAEHGAVYVNANLFEEETGIDWSTDTMDGGMHLNTAGAEKYTLWFYERCLSSLGLTDCRSDPAVSSVYTALAERYAAEKNKQAEEAS